MHGSNSEDGRIGEWMHVNSGGRFFPLDPRPEEVNIDDIANGLALTCRYGGHGDVEKFYSVAEHCYLLAEAAKNEGYPSHVQLACLLHDAAEAYTGDMIRAMKHSIGKPFGDIEDTIQNVIFEKYKVAETFRTHGDYIKSLDTRITVNEKHRLMLNPQPWATDDLRPIEGITLLCYKPSPMKYLYLKAFHRLIRDMHLENER